MMEKYLHNYSNTIYPFHMPGHKLGRLSPLGSVNLYNIDVTEVDGTDNLHQPEGIIFKAQERAKRLYKSLDTFFLVNGSSSGILSAISACCIPDGQILIARNSHKSVYHSVQINRLDPIYVYPEFIKEHGILGGINPLDVRKALEQYPKIACVVITSPTFEGFTSDIAAIAEIVHYFGKILIVDEAHGAHFKCHSSFPHSALECGADIVIHSLHKTLPAFTQTALLHMNSNRVDIEKLKQYLAIYQSSSPSYIFMAGIDSCIRWMEEQGSTAFDQFTDRVAEFRNKISSLTQIGLLGEELIGQYSVFGADLSRLVFIGKDKTINGKKIDLILRRDYFIQVEMSTLQSVVAISTVADQMDGFQKLFNALHEIDCKNDYIITEMFDIINTTAKVFHPFAASQKRKVRVDLKDAKNRICGQYITLYPPGIPILIPGEVITHDIICTLNHYINHGLTVIGIDLHQVSVLSEV